MICSTEHHSLRVTCKPRPFQTPATFRDRATSRLRTIPSCVTSETDAPNNSPLSVQLVNPRYNYYLT
jgi:hypothetical protein